MQPLTHYGCMLMTARVYPIQHRKKNFPYISSPFIPLFHRRLRHLSATQDMYAVHEVAAFARKLFAEGKKVPHVISTRSIFIAIISIAFTSNAALCRLRQRARSRRRHAPPYTPARCAHFPRTQKFSSALLTRPSSCFQNHHHA
jgi:hypothetical protein